MVRIKHRYLLINILYPEISKDNKTTKDRQNLPEVIQFHRPTPDALTPQLLAHSIREEILLLYGDYGAGVTSGSLSVKYFSPATSTAILRCSRAHYRLVWAALTFMTSIPLSSKNAEILSCVFQVVRVSGTIRKSEEEAIKRARATILRAKKETTENAMAGLDAIFGQPGNDAGRNSGKEKGDPAGIEDSDLDDDLASSSANDNGL